MVKTQNFRLPTCMHVSSSKHNKYFRSNLLLSARIKIWRENLILVRINGEIYCMKVKSYVIDFPILEK